MVRMVKLVAINDSDGNAEMLRTETELSLEWFEISLPTYYEYRSGANEVKQATGMIRIGPEWPWQSGIKEWGVEMDLEGAEKLIGRLHTMVQAARNLIPADRMKANR